MTATTKPDSDEAIARQAQAGSLADFEELVRRYEIRIHRFVVGRCRDARDAQEVTQDVFVAAYRGLARFDARRSFATWLFTIARRKCIDCHRASRFVPDDSPPEPADANDPAVLLARRESGADLWQLARHVLTTVQFDVLWLRYAEDMAVAEIARVMTRTGTHVKVLLFRARLRMEAELRKQSDEATSPTISAQPHAALTLGSARSVLQTLPSESPSIGT